MSISSALDAIAKIVYSEDVPHAFVTQNSLFDDCKKKTDVGGKSYEFSVAQSQGACGSADYTAANTIASNVQYTRFSVTPVTDYALARMNGEDYERLSSDEGALVDAWKDRIDAAVYEARRSLSIMLFRDGLGVRGTISAGSNVATATITLDDGALGSSEIHNFYQGMQVQASQTAGGALRDAGAAETVAKVDRAAGTLGSTSVAWNTVITALAAGDSLYRRGDAKAGGAVKVITGLGEWLVGGSSPAALFGATRNVDPVALAGTAFDGTNVPMEEAVLELASRVSIESEGEKALYCHPRDKVQVVKLLEGKSRIMRPSQGPEAKVGFERIMFDTDNGPMALKGDVNVKRRQAFLVAPEQCELVTKGKAAKILDKDGQSVRARDAFDSYEMRIGTYGLFCVKFPGGMGRISNWGA